MAVAERRCSRALAALLLLGCGEEGANEASSRAGVDSAALAALAALHYDARTPARDASNHVSGNPLARALGQRLFFDPRLSGPLIEGDNDGSPGTLGVVGEAGRVSCASCHSPAAGFVDARSPHRQISLAAGWTRRRTPTLLESHAVSLYNWDGRRDSIWSQAIGVMESDREFNSGRLFVAQQVARFYASEYEALFGALPPLADTTRFPSLTPEEAGCRQVLRTTGATLVCRGKPGDAADYDGLAPADRTSVTRVAVDVAKSLAAYVEALRCGPSRFDDWLDGNDSALSAAELRGALLFVGKAACNGCHSGPNLSDQAFHNVGLSPAPVAVAFVDTDDRGAAEARPLLLDDPLNTHGEFSDGARAVSEPADLSEPAPPQLEGAFRTPTLRCTTPRPSFMHTGQLRSLEQVVAFFDRAGDPPGHYPGTNELVPLGLDASEQADLVAFLGALEGPGPPADLLVAP